MAIQPSYRALISGCLILALLGTGCKKKAPTPAPAPAPAPAPTPPPALPTATLRVDPPLIGFGGTALLWWNTTNATDVWIEPGAGKVAPEGNHAVRPRVSTTYLLTAKGPGGSAGATARLTVTVPRQPAASIPERPPSLDDLWKRDVKTIYFDYDKAEVRPDQRPALEATARLLMNRLEIQITIAGNCDERGSAEYNLGLGDRRANILKEYLETAGVPLNRIETISYGKEKPVCNQSTEDCWQRNRRGDFVRR